MFSNIHLVIVVVKNALTDKITDLPDIGHIIWNWYIVNPGFERGIKELQPIIANMEY